MPGAPFMDTQRVAHGSVAEVHYFSTALSRTRRMHVYTPPGYEKNRDAYPVFYLLHGAFDGDDSWSTVGRAGFIVDNLIAAGDARPMIVVMPDGHTSRFGGGGAAGSTRPTSCSEFNADIKPYVESTYRIRDGPRVDRDRGPLDGRRANARHRVRRSCELRLRRRVQLRRVRHRRTTRIGKTRTARSSTTPR